jgi:pyruvate dehydrogenase E2 component (dihydrolipoamide acetyltransferase)
MATVVEVPKLGNTVEECLISKWIKRKGDAVAAGDLVAEIETDKTTFEVTAPVAGTLIETFFEEGAVAPVFTSLFAIGEPGENVEQFRPGAPATPGAPETVSPAPPPASFAAPVSAHAAPYSPRARKFAEEHNFFPENVTGSGPGGRVLEQDLRALYQPPRRPASGIRERIARRMRDSLASTAQYTLHSSANAAGLLAMRARFKAGGSDININDLVSFCTVRALLDMPALNRNLAEIHLGFACDTDRGLLVPVIRDAHRLALAELAARGRELAARAAAGTISPDDLAGATFTVSNLGGLGIESFTPILTPPQVAILGVGAIGLKAVRREGRVEFIDAIGLSLTCDHQSIDGAPGARFLQIVRDKIENVERECQNRS